MSLDDQAADPSPAPTIGGVATLRVRRPMGYYDPTTGYLPLYDDGYDYCAGKVDPTIGPPPVAVLAYNDPLQTEYPVFAVTKNGVYLRAGLDPGRVTRRRTSEAFDVTLVFAYSNPETDYVDTRNDRTPDACYPGYDLPIGPAGGLIVRGRNLLGDGSVTLASSPGQHRPGDLSSVVFLQERAVIRPVSILYDTVTERPLLGIQDEWAYVEFDSPRGAALTRSALRWLAAPAIDSVGPTDHVVYDQVMTIVGHNFAAIRDLTFSWRFSEEHLTSATSDPPGPGQYFVVDPEHIHVRLSPTGPVPRALASVCVPCDVSTTELVYTEQFPGVRTFTVVNELGKQSVNVNAVDPSSVPDPPRPIQCPYCAQSPGNISGGVSRPPDPPPPPPLPPRLPVHPGGGCGSNTICMP